MLRAECVSMLLEALRLGLSPRPQPFPHGHTPSSFHTPFFTAPVPPSPSTKSSLVKDSYLLKNVGLIHKHAVLEAGPDRLSW